MNKRKKITIIEPIIILICLVVISLTTSITHGIIMSESMIPTLPVGKQAFYFKYAYVLSPPKHGDIIGFDYDGEFICKRVIGIAGDTITFNNDGYVYLNGIKQEEEYAEGATLPHNKDSYTIPDNTVFVLGDNRMNSYDSRFWDDPYVPTSDIIGKFMFLK